MDFKHFVILYLVTLIPPASSSDADALLSLKSFIDPSNSLPWRGNNPCNWFGIRDCIRGRVSKLVLEFLNLTGTLDGASLSRLDQLRVLSFKGNSISGQIPNLSSLINLKSIYLNDNRFTGEFPVALSRLHRLKIVVLSNNRISGHIPFSLVRLSRLYTFYLQDNLFEGDLPPFKQTSLRFFNVSNNRISGRIPFTGALARFNESSFSGNIDLCGEQINKSCSRYGLPTTPYDYPSSPERNPISSNRLAKIIVGGIVGGFIVLIVICLLLLCLLRKNRGGTTPAANKDGIGKGLAQDDSGSRGNKREKKGGFAWETCEGVGDLVFLGAEDQLMNYSLEDLLKASAETLGRGTIGSTYKAVMVSGFIVTVKRLKDANYPRADEFRRHVEAVGRLRHSNLVPLRAYFQAKEERLFVYDYYPNGSLYALIHGTRNLKKEKPLHWTSCLKIAEDLASGLLYIHQNPGLTHGNLKSSNILLGSDFELCLTDYCLTPLRNPDFTEETSTTTSLFYRAPECRDLSKPPTQQADVYSFGVLLVELLTGKIPSPELVQCPDISSWVQSVREEHNAEGSKVILRALLNIAAACVALVPEHRPKMKEVLKSIRDARAEAQVSSNSSSHSPGRWSDTVQSFPGDDHSSI